MNIKQAAEFLGCSESRIHRLSHLRQIPCTKSGNRLIFFEDELNEWLEQGRKKTMNEIDNAADDALLKKKSI